MPLFAQKEFCTLVDISLRTSGILDLINWVHDGEVSEVRKASSVLGNNRLNLFITAAAGHCSDECGTCVVTACQDIKTRVYCYGHMITWSHNCMLV